MFVNSICQYLIYTKDVIKKRLLLDTFLFQRDNPKPVFEHPSLPSNPVGI